jgi:hypothetical protein
MAQGRNSQMVMIPVFHLKAAGWRVFILQIE